MTMKISRYKKILSLISRSGPKSRVDFVNAFNLTLSGAKRVVDDLQARKLLVRIGQKQALLGRPSDIFDFNPEFGLLGALEIGKMWAHSALYDFSARQLKRREYRMDFSVSPQEFMMRLINDLQEWITEYPGRKLLSTAIAAGGIVNSSVRTIAYLNQNTAWQTICLDSIIPAGYIPAPTLISYATAALTAEARSGTLANVMETSLFFHLGSNAVSAFMINGQIYENSDAVPGQLAHIPLTGNTLHCYCGNVGCAEGLISTQGMLRQFEQAVHEGAVNTICDITIENMVRGDRLSLRILENSCRIAGDLLAGAVNLLAPRYIVLGGLVFFLEPELGHRLKNIIEDSIREKSFPGNAEHLEVKLSSLVNESMITGAALAARNQWIEENG